MLLGRLSALVLYLALVNPTSAYCGEFERVSAGLIADGQIDEAFVAYLTANLRPNDRLMIDSPGGDPSAALKLTKLLVARAVSVTVNGECTNECAVYAFLPARVREASVGASVRFGPSPFLFDDRARGGPNEAAVHKHLLDYQALLPLDGSAASLLACTDAALKARTSTSVQVPGRPFLRLPTVFAQAVVSPTVMAQFGVKVGGAQVWTEEAEYRALFQHEEQGRLTWVDDVGGCSGTA